MRVRSAITFGTATGLLVALAGCANFLDPPTLPYRLSDGTSIVGWTANFVEYGRPPRSLTVEYTIPQRPDRLEFKTIKAGDRFHGFVLLPLAETRFFVGGPDWQRENELDEDFLWSHDQHTLLTVTEPHQAMKRGRQYIFADLAITKKPQS